MRNEIRISLNAGNLTTGRRLHNFGGERRFGGGRFGENKGVSGKYDLYYLCYTSNKTNIKNETLKQ